jgi:hypothetical protein
LPTATRPGSPKMCRRSSAPRARRRPGRRASRDEHAPRIAMRRWPAVSLSSGPAMCRPWFAVIISRAGRAARGRSLLRSRHPALERPGRDAGVSGSIKGPWSDEPGPCSPGAGPLPGCVHARSAAVGLSLVGFRSAALSPRRPRGGRGLRRWRVPGWRIRAAGGGPGPGSGCGARLSAPPRSQPRPGR